MKTIISINKLRIYAFHGVLDLEHSVGNEYQIDCQIEADLNKAMQSDQMSDTINYAEVVEVIKREMIIPSTLLEHVSGRIFEKFQKQWPNIIHIDLTISKITPPISGANIESCSFRAIL